MWLLLKYMLIDSLVESEKVEMTILNMLNRVADLLTHLLLNKYELYFSFTNDFKISLHVNNCWHFWIIIIKFKNWIQFKNLHTTVIYEATITFWKWTVKFFDTLFFFLKIKCKLNKFICLARRKDHWYTALGQYGNLPRSRGSMLLIDLPVWNLFLTTVTSSRVENSVHLELRWHI